MSKETNVFAVISLVAGVLSWMGMPIAAAVVAVAAGHAARSQIRSSGEEGAGLALAGLILGYANLLLLCAALGLLALFWAGLVSLAVLAPAS